ncbi:MAG: type I methionyl aminopeptidase [Pseudobdellovibrio sp.]|nr:type I methionyl aminopeptidase [Pseudobdellovibrio sp.]
MSKSPRTPVPLTKAEIEKMRVVCKMAAKVLNYTASKVKPGITTLELDKIANDYTEKLGGTSACIGYYGYPFATCISVNEVVCHGTPSDYVIKEGDILNIDVTVKKDGFFGDTSKTVMVGKVSKEAESLVDAAYNAMMTGIEAIKPNGYTGDIGFETNKYVQRRGYTTVKEIGGHGIGKIFHMDPFVPAFGKRGKGEKIIPWTCFTVEPMVNEGVEDFDEYSIPNSDIKYYITSDKKLSAQFEHTVLITDTGYEILTLE